MTIHTTNSATASAETVGYTPARVDGFEGSVTLKKVDKKRQCTEWRRIPVIKSDSCYRRRR